MHAAWVASVRPAYRPLAVAIAALAVFAALFIALGVNGWWTPAANEQTVGRSHAGVNGCPEGCSGNR